MKPLVRPYLFAVARLGLFLAVVAWTVGQWWDVEFLVHGFRHKLIVSQNGLTINDNWVDGRFLEIARYLSGETSPEPPDSERGWVELSETGAVIPESGQRLRWVLPGVGWRQTGSSSVHFRHWLIVSIFALFYGVLKWICRKRPTIYAGPEKGREDVY